MQLEQYSYSEPDAGRVELGGEHEGDVEGHGRPQFGRQCKHCIDAGACHRRQIFSEISFGAFLHLVRGRLL